MGQRVLRDFPRGKAQDDCCRGLRRSIKIEAVKSKKYDHRGEGSPLVAVNEWVIARNAKSVGGREDGKIGLAVSELIDRSRQGQLEKSDIPDAIGAAEQSKLLGVEIEDDASVEPFRLTHFARAL